MNFGWRTCVRACSKKIDSVGQPYSADESDETDPKSGASAIKDFALQSIYKSVGLSNVTGISEGSGGCVKSLDRKAMAQDKREKDRERKEMLDKIKTQKDEITKYKEELDKQRNEANEKRR